MTNGHVAVSLHLMRSDVVASEAGRRPLRGSHGQHASDGSEDVRENIQRR